MLQEWFACTRAGANFLTVTTKIIGSFCDQQTSFPLPLCHLIPLSATTRTCSLLHPSPLPPPCWHNRRRRKPCCPAHSICNSKMLQGELWNCFRYSHALFTVPNPGAGNICCGREQMLRYIPAISRKQVVPHRSLPVPTSQRCPCPGRDRGLISP